MKKETILAQLSVSLGYRTALNVGNCSRSSKSIVQLLYLTSDKKEIILERWINQSYSGQLEMDIKDTVREWYENPRRNFGLELRAFDEDNTQLDVYQLFHILNCSEAESKCPM